MRDVVRLPAEEIAPPAALVFAAQGVPPAAAAEARFAALLAGAMDLHQRLARPLGLVEEVSREEFDWVYAGEGHNDERTPVGDIHPRARRRALFVVTLGLALEQEIARLFAASEFALGAMLDAAASSAADLAAGRLARRYGDACGAAHGGARALEYSPGYCGWHISGQRRLFERLRPGEIGVALNDSFLMQPLKSVSGVILVGPAEIHEHDESYPCCRMCRTRTCRERRADAVAGDRHGNPPEHRREPL